MLNVNNREVERCSAKVKISSVTGSDCDIQIYTQSSWTSIAFIYDPRSSQTFAYGEVTHKFYKTEKLHLNIEIQQKKHTTQVLLNYKLRFALLETN